MRIHRKVKQQHKLLFQAIAIHLVNPRTIHPFSNKTTTMWFCPLNGTLLPIITSSATSKSSTKIFASARRVHTPNPSHCLKYKKTFPANQKKVNDISGEASLEKCQ
mmetsp:Transcript_22434/g.48647  ORF Transcript_22434/g.48647 Transcript_22434/m.48647 type:complete len:106 (+) Transcript_22434:782-1099(+)